MKLLRMIHLLPTISQVLDRIILNKMTDCVELSETQFGSRKRRSCYNCVQICKDFLAFHGYKNCAVLTVDVAGGFDNIDTGLLMDPLMYRGCTENLIDWVR